MIKISFKQSAKSTMPPIWTFEFRKDRMTKEDLNAYQKKLLEIRDKYSRGFQNLAKCKFHAYEAPLPPKDNIFARFEYDCSRHKFQSHGKHNL